MKRIFIALWPDSSTAAEIAQTTAAWGWPLGCRRYAVTDLHVTLHFIGSVPEERLGQIRQALRVPFEPFTLTLDTPRRWHGGLAVLCPTSTPAALDDLYERLGRILHDQGLAVSPRGLVPHVTLARRCDAMELPQSCPPVTWRVGGYALMLSTGDALERYVMLENYAG